MNVSCCLALVISVVVCTCFYGETDAWRGNYYNVRVPRYYYHYYCSHWHYRWECCSYHYHLHWQYWHYEGRCSPGWTHNGNQNCNIPLCRPTCGHGKCVSPNVCKCPSTSYGYGCRHLTCSYKRPCYPGECQTGNTCDCEPGFRADNVADGCIVFNNASFTPTLYQSKTTLSHIRRLDKRVDFNIVIDSSNKETKEILWSNQNKFNNLKFEFESLFTPPDDLPERPPYVHDAKIGIVRGQIEVNVSKIPRDGGLIRDTGLNQTHKCHSGFSQLNPATESAKCEIDDDQFSTLIEHGDWLSIKFMSDSGGFQKLTNLDTKLPYATKYYKGMRDIKEIEFRFDFVAPKHCTERGVTKPCPNDAHILRVDNEFTKDPIKLSWSGWIDDMSGVWTYFVEVFKLSPDAYGRLTEMSPLQPVFCDLINMTENSAENMFLEYRPNESGMYSILLDTRDQANNSRSARRFALYDNTSSVTLNGEMYISSAVEETGYMWQTSAGDDFTIDVNWANHFVNKMHQDGMFLNNIQPYPIQFEDLKDDNILYSKKFVNASLDDHEGERTTKAIQHFHGIVKFEMAKEYTLKEDIPDSAQWSEITPLAETTTFTAELDDGARVKIWLRATDVMGNQAVDSRTVHFDKSPPTISNYNTLSTDHKVVLNVDDGMYNYTSRFTFTASDPQSGVYKIGYEIIVHTDGMGDRAVYENATSASIGEIVNPNCRVVGGTCFIPKQTLDVNNCWFMVDKANLDMSTATVKITAYNQALLTTTTTFEVGKITDLKGLEKYSGPTNIRIENKSPTGFRIAWDLPDKTSCYGIAEIVLIIMRKNGDGQKEVIHTCSTSATSRFFDVLALNPSSEYEIGFSMKISGGTPSAVTSLEARTQEEEKYSGVSAGTVAGIVAVGSFIIYEYCEHGTLKDYLIQQNKNMTIELQECLFRFVLDIAKGMEHLDAKGIVHRLLAARNILRTFLNEVKISGFGQQPSEGDDGEAGQGKEERIPVKCMTTTKDATEKSDVLWDIFTMANGTGATIFKHNWYDVMKKCWSYDPGRRPTFSDIRNELDSLFTEAPGDNYYYSQR